jgi:type VI secretion system protein VasJ
VTFQLQSCARSTVGTDAARVTGEDVAPRTDAVGFTSGADGVGTGADRFTGEDFAASTGAARVTSEDAGMSTDAGRVTGEDAGASTDAGRVTGEDAGASTDARRFTSGADDVGTGVGRFTSEGVGASTGAGRFTSEGVAPGTGDTRVTVYAATFVCEPASGLQSCARSSTVALVGTFREEAAERLAQLIAPIPGASPSGADVSYDPDFERIKAEIDKLSSMAGGAPTWRDVESTAAALLSGKSKDLRVASWMTVAKLKTGGWKGFAEALIVYEGVASAFWDTMYPEAKRARARVNVFAWMADMAAQALQGTDVAAADGDAVRACAEVLSELDQLLADKLGDAYPGPGQLRSVLRDKVRSIPEPAPAPAAAPAPASPPATGGLGPATTAAPSAAAPSAAVATTAAAAAPLLAEPIAPAVVPAGVADVDASVRENAGAIMQAASILRASDPASPWAYRLQRWGAWITVQSAPPAENGRTRIRPPPEAFARRLAALRDAQNWLELLGAAESATGTYLFWLDLHRMVALAMDRLGATFIPAREAVGREVAAFVARTPGAAGLAFADGVPFADAATKTWLDDEAKRWGGASGPSVSAAATSAEDEEVAKRFAEAQKLVTDGKVADGLALAVALAERSPDGRTRFRARLAVGRMALDGGKPELGRPMLEHLAGEIDRHDLESWEPGLCATLYASLLVATREAARAKGAPPDLAARATVLFDKLSRLDPASAIKLSG